jgi:hypothetical protein
MKSILAALIVFTALPVLPLIGANPTEKRLTMEQRIQDTDISVALKHYEGVRTELLNARLRQELAEAEQAGTPAERENQFRILTRRIELLERYAKNLRDGLLKAGQLDVAASAHRN